MVNLECVVCSQVAGNNEGRAPCSGYVPYWGRGGFCFVQEVLCHPTRVTSELLGHPVLP